MPAKEFENDREYAHWLNENPNGFIVNMGSPCYMVLHKASCKHISEPTHETSPGGFTEHKCRKVGALDIKLLRDWAASHLRPGSSLKECSHCRPTG